MADYPIYDFDPRNIPQDFLAAIGFVSVTWEQTQSVIDAAIEKLAGIPDMRLGACITTHMTGPQRIQALKTLSKLRFGPDAFLAFEVLVKRLNDAAKARNDVVHGRWQLDCDGVGTAKITARSELDAAVTFRSAQSIAAIGHEIFDVGECIIYFFRGIKMPLFK